VVFSWVEEYFFKGYLKSDYVDLGDLMIFITKHFGHSIGLNEYDWKFMDNNEDQWKRYIVTCMYFTCISKNEYETIQCLEKLSNSKFKLDFYQGVKMMERFLREHTENVYPKFLEKINQVNQNEWSESIHHAANLELIGRIGSMNYAQTSKIDLLSFWIIALNTMIFINEVYRIILEFTVTILQCAGITLVG
jgi:hypothetical protein